MSDYVIAASVLTTIGVLVWAAIMPLLIVEVAPDA